MKSHTLSLFVLGIVVLGGCLPGWADPVLTLTRTASGPYVAGATLDITVTLSLSDSSVPTALGVEDTLPAGWSYNSMVSANGPGIAPPSGTTGLLEMAWFPVPTLPVTFTYRVNVPASATGTQQVTGYGLCRISGSAEIDSATVTTNIAPPNPTQFTLMYTAGANGTISGTSPQTVNSGTSGTAVTAVPNTGYQFVNWSDGQTVNPRTDTNVTANITVTASFAANGTPVLTLTRTALPYTAGSTLDITVTLSLSDTSVPTALGVEDTLPAGWSYNSMVSANGPGIAPPSGTTGLLELAWFPVPTLPVTFTYRVNVPASATGTQQITGYGLCRISGSAEIDSATVTTNIALLNPPQFTLMYTADTNGSISGTLQQTVNSGASGAAVTAVANTGYHFAQWSDSSTQNPRTDTNVTANISVTATFVANSAPVLTLARTASGPYTAGSTLDITVTLSLSDSSAPTALGVEDTLPAGWSYNSMVSANGPGIAPPSGTTGLLELAWFPVPTLPVTFTYRVNVPASATGTQQVTGYGLCRISGSAEIDSATVTTNVPPLVSLTVTPANQPVTAAVGSTTFAIQTTADWTASSDQTWATLSASSGTGNATFTVTYTANAGAQRTANITVTGTGTIPGFVVVTVTQTAATYVLAYTAAANGTISGTSPQTVNYGDSGSAVTAAPATGYRFVQWSDSSTQNPRTDANVTANLSLTATFVLETGALTVTIQPAGAVSAGAQWAVDGGTEHASSATVSGLSVGQHDISFTTVSGWVAPTSQSVTIVANQTVTASVTYTQLQVSLQPGWNMVSFWTNPAPADWTSIFGDAIYTNSVWTWNPVNKQYQIATEANAYMGYWIEAKSAGSFSITSGIPSTPEVNLETGWNMFGPFADLPISELACANSLFWKWTAPNGPYAQETNALEPGIGYWAKVSADVALPCGKSMPAAAKALKSKESTLPLVKTSATTLWTIGLQVPGLNLMAGMDSTATDGFDEGLDADAPPPPPEGGFGYFASTITGHPELANYFLPISNTATWTIQIDNEQSSARANITWSFSGNTTGRAFTLLRQSDQQTFDMSTVTSVPVPAGSNETFTMIVSIVNTHTLTYTAGPNGTITGISPQTVNSGTSGTAVTAVPSTGYQFVQWSDGATQNPRTDSNVTASVTVTAIFGINTYTLTYTAGMNGTISGASPQTVNYGGSGTAVTAVPVTGYHFVQWSDGATQNPRTDANVATGISVSASFAINTYTLTYTAGAKGTISGSSPQTVNYGGSGSAVTAVASNGYHFVSWSDSSTQNPRTDANVTASMNMTASFAVNTYMLTTSVSGGHGTLLPASGPQQANSAVTLIAAPDSGYEVKQWTGTDNDSVKVNANVVTMSGDKSVTVEFELIPAVSTYTLTTVVVGGHGTIDPAGQNDEAVNSVVFLTAYPDQGYEVQEWNGTALDLFAGNHNTVLMTHSKTVTLQFQPIAPQGIAGLLGTLWQHWTLLGAGAGQNVSGEVTVNLASTDNPAAIDTLVVGLRDANGNYIPGSTPTVIWNAVPATLMPPLDYTLMIPALSQPTTFYAWLYDAQENGNTDAAIADFENAKATGADAWNRLLGQIDIAPDYWLTTSVTDNVGGTITPAPPGIQGTQNQVITLTATPDQPYHLAAWQGTDDDTLTALTNTVTMTKAKQVAVQFQLNIDAVVSLDLTVVSDHGTVAAVEQPPYRANQVVDLVATPEPGYVVARWIGTDNDLALTTMNKVTLASLDNEVSVEFEPTSLTVMLTTAVVGGHGNLTPQTGPQPQGSIVQLTAIPDTGYKVQAWSGTDNDALTTNSNTVTMSDAKSVTVQFTLICKTPAAPTGATASAGTYPDQVLVSWQPVDGAVSYSVSRAPAGSSSGQEVIAASVTGAAQYADTSAVTAVEETILGCIPNGTFDYTKYNYWVTATNDCGNTSAFSDPPATGWCGNGSKALLEKALPVHTGVLSTLYVRLLSQDGIVPASVWATVQGLPVAVGWVPISATDGWVVCRPQTPWQAGQAITVTVGAMTESGTALGPETRQFTAEASGNVAKDAANVWQPSYKDFDASNLDLTKESNNELVLSQLEDKTLPVLSGGIGPVYQLGPEIAFDTPQRVWLPVPAGADANDLRLYYYHVGEDAGWYPGENVEGWLVPASELLVTIKGTIYLGFLVNHAGIVQLVPAEQKANVASASVAPPHGMTGDLLMLAALIGTLVGAGKTRRARQGK